MSLEKFKSLEKLSGSIKLIRLYIDIRYLSPKVNQGAVNRVLFVNFMCVKPHSGKRENEVNWGITSSWTLQLLSGAILDSAI